MNEYSLYAQDVIKQHKIEIEKQKQKIKDFLNKNCLYGSLLEEYDKKHTPNELLLKTGFPKLDEKIMGLLPENIVILGARSHIGKTTLLTNILKNVSEQLKENELIIFFSLEESRSSVATRLLSLYKREKLSALKFNGLKNKYKREELQRDFYNNIIIVSEQDTTPETINEICENIHKTEYKIKGIFIDHLQIFNIYGNDNTHKIMGENLKDLKAIARKFQLNVFLISQIGREYEKRVANAFRIFPPKLSDLKESGNIEQYADLVLFLYNQNTISSNGQPGLKVLSLNVAKNRNGMSDLNFFIEFWQEYGLMLEIKKTKKEEVENEKF